MEELFPLIVAQKKIQVPEHDGLNFEQWFLIRGISLRSVRIYVYTRCGV